MTFQINGELNQRKMVLHYPMLIMKNEFYMFIVNILMNLPITIMI